MRIAVIESTRSRRNIVALAALLFAVLAVAATAGARALSARAHYPSVQIMIVGKGGRILLPARTVTVAPASLHVEGHSCAVPAGTPLAALADLARGHVHAPLAVKAYAPCNSNAATAESLFVTSIDGVRPGASEKSDGWSYKIGNRSGTAAAGSEQGPFGNGHKLASGQDVLWFWCVFHGESCQPTLGVTPSRARVAAGGELTVTVHSYDEAGKATPAAGATVTLGSRTTTAGGGGNAKIAVPSRPGRYELSARKRGLVTAFQRTIVVTAAGG